MLPRWNSTYRIGWRQLSRAFIGEFSNSHGSEGAVGSLQFEHVALVVDDLANDTAFAVDRVPVLIVRAAGQIDTIQEQFAMKLCLAYIDTC